MKVVWTDQALSRLIEIEEFVASDNPIAATELTAKLITRGEALATLWKRGRRVPELPASPLREVMRATIDSCTASASQPSRY